MIRLTIVRTNETEDEIDRQADVTERKYEICTRDNDVSPAWLWEALKATHIGPRGWDFLANMVTYCWEDEKHHYDEGTKSKGSAIIKRFADAAFAMANFNGWDE